MNFKMLMLSLLILLLVVPTFTQEREKKAGPPDFKKDVAIATKAFDAGDYSTCLKHLTRASSAVMELRRARLLAVFPVLADFEVKDNTDYKQVRNNKFAAGMAGFTGAMGNIIERTYQEKGGNKRLKITLHLDSPMASTFGSMLGMMGGGKDAEVITYTNAKALLKKERNAYGLQAILLRLHMLDAKGTNFTDEELLKVFSQDLIDKIIAVLSK